MTANARLSRVASKRRLLERYSWVAVALAAIAGSVDAIGYLLLAKIFTSHMSGNTVAMAMPLATRNWAEGWRHLEPLVAFFLGVTLGFVAVDLLAQAKASRLFAMIACAETTLLIAFLLVSHPAPQWAVVFPAAALGAQNALLRRVGHRSIRTTFITGMLTDCARGLVETIRCAIAHDRAGTKEHLREFTLHGGIWFSFAVGSVAGAGLAITYAARALLLPIIALLALSALDLARPLTQPDET